MLAFPNALSEIMKYNCFINEPIKQSENWKKLVSHTTKVVTFFKWAYDVYDN